jgi:hypothetical protein
MKRDSLTRALGAVLGLGYVALGIAESINHMDAFSLDWLPLVWFPALCGGGVLVLLGVFKVVSPAWASIGLVTVGALAGALAALWTVAAPFLSIALIVLTVLRSTSAPAARLSP